MLLSNLTSGQAFRAVWRATLVFLLVSLLAGLLLVKVVENTLLQDLRTQVEVEASLLSEIYQDKGSPGLLQALRATEGTPRVPAHMAGLLNADGVTLTGPVSRVPEFIGTRRMEVSELTAAAVSGVYMTHVKQLHSNTLIVGQSDQSVRTARQRLIVGMGVFIGLMVPLFLALGLWSSRQSLQRLNAMEATLQQVGDGDLSARLPIHGSNDQFDRLSISVNENLEQLERVISGMKSTVTSIAHDLKTPLSHVQIALSSAADRVENGADPLPKIEEAIDETEQLNAIFESILRITRIRTSSVQKSSQPVQLHKIAAQSIEFLTPMAEENNQTITLNADRDLSVRGDQGMLLQATINLLKNAVVHAGDGAVINVTIDEQSLSVEDNGPGVDTTDLDRLVEFFVRGDASRGTAGSGLGLALVKAVADHHGAGLILRNLTPGFLARIQFPIPDGA